MFVVGIIWILYYALLALLAFIVLRACGRASRSRRLPLIVSLAILVAGISVDVFPYFKWREYCSYDDMQAHEKVQVDGFSVSFPLLDSTINRYMRSGYKYIEVTDVLRGGFIRHDLVNGELRSVHYGSSISKYRLDQDLIYEDWVVRSRRRVIDLSKGEAIGEVIKYGYVGGAVVQVLMDQFGGEIRASEYCGGDGGDVIELTLKPSGH